MERVGLRCVDNSYQNSLTRLRSSAFRPYGVGLRQWYYQTCTEFGYYQTCEDPSCPFSRRLTLRSQLDVCREVFGIKPESAGSAVGFTNDYYGADRPKFTRILFVNGNIDPWHALSVTTNQSSSELAIVINGTAHCANMLPPEPEDPASLRQARKIDDQVGKWLALARQKPT
uniref:Thymus-specific serine protease-like n=1 Tax=Callorhinchus milii TaxID=7868 RepID=A0A4W3GJE0_CALMI